MSFWLAGGRIDGTGGSTQERQDTVHFSLYVLNQVIGLVVDGCGLVS